MVGCVSKWDLRAELPVNQPVPYFLDQDGDGWGDPESDEQRQLSGDVDSGYTARNNRDCDDNDANVTGRVGSICPVQMVVGGSDWVGTVLQDQELVALYGTTDPVWTDAAQDACEDWGTTLDGGTNGKLAILTGERRSAVIEALDLKLGGAPFAGFVGASPQDDVGAEWSWDDDETLIEDTDLCDDFVAQPSLERLALVHRSGEWCYGTPENAFIATPGPDAPAYAKFYGHFICQRDQPDPADYDQGLPLEETEEPAEQSEP